MESKQTCTHCGALFEHARVRKTCSKECRYASLRVEKPVLTDEQRLANEMLRRQRSAAGRRGQKRTPEQCARIGAGVKASRARHDWQKGVPRPPEVRAKLSAAGLLAYKEGRSDATGYYRNKWHAYDGPHGRINMRSQSEVIFAQKLDAHNIEWQYEPERFDLGWTTYRPDFYLPAFDTYVEVKGWLTEESAAKMDAFRAEGKRLIMTTFKEVREAALPHELEEVTA